MLMSILSEIQCLRGYSPTHVNLRNSNRYCVLLWEPDGSQTAYCFNTPIYNSKTMHMVSLQFSESNKKFLFSGSSCVCSISEEGITLEDFYGKVKIPTSSQPILHGDHICFDQGEIFPTLNGLRFHTNQGANATCKLEVLSHNRDIRANTKCISFMRENHIPFASISVLGSVNDKQQLLSPATIQYEATGNNEFTITMTTQSSADGIAFEVNLYEQKLFQDTTVESKNPQENNAFGSIAWIGTSQEFGDQWLYSRPDINKLPFLYERKIEKAMLWVPKLSQKSVSLSAFQVPLRFCSFGSQWENKVALGAGYPPLTETEHYYSVNLHTSLSQRENHHLQYTDGLIIRESIKASGYSAISTGDSCCAPQILEINYK